MRSLFMTAALLAMTTLLVNCGGGGAPSSQSIAATCDSTTLWASHPTASGRGIPDNNTTGISVTWDNQNCPVRSVSTAFLEICLDHDDPTDLAWSLSQPGSGSPSALTVPSNWNSTGSNCDSGQGKLQRIDLLRSISSTVTPRGIWQLQVKDQIAGDAGTLIQWRVIIQGNT